MARILVVDEGRRLGLREMLEPHGYQVAEAADGLEALRLQDGDPADLVIADLAGLGNGERNPLRELMRKYPLLKVIAVSREGAAGFHVHDGWMPAQGYELLVAGVDDPDRPVAHLPCEGQRAGLRLQPALAPEISANGGGRNDGHGAEGQFQGGGQLLAAAIGGIVVGPEGDLVLVADHADRTVGLDGAVLLHLGREGVFEDMVRGRETGLDIPALELEMIAYVGPGEGSDAGSLFIGVKVFVKPRRIGLGRLQQIEYGGQGLVFDLDPRPWPHQRWPRLPRPPRPPLLPHNEPCPGPGRARPKGIRHAENQGRRRSRLP